MIFCVISCVISCDLLYDLAMLSGGNQWTTGIRAEIASVVDDTLQHVPAPRLLQMYVTSVCVCYSVYATC